MRCASSVRLNYCYGVLVKISFQVKAQGIVPGAVHLEHAVSSPLSICCIDVGFWLSQDGNIMVDCLVLRDTVIWVIGNVELYHPSGTLGAKHRPEDDAIGQDY